MSWGMFGCESPGWSSALVGDHRADLTGTAAAGVESPGALDMGRSHLAGDLLQAPQHIPGVKGPGDAAGAAGVNMASPGVEAVIALRSALAPAGFVETGQAAEGNQVHPPVSPGSRVSTGILRPLPRYDSAQPLLEVEPAPARDFGI